MKDINLTKEELNAVKRKKCLGSGVDGSVYDIGNGLVYKLYHNMSDYIFIESKGKYDSHGVNITDIKELRNKGIRVNHKPINYVDSEGVTLSRETAIRKAIEKQKYVKYTTLPMNIIKVNGRLAGCVYRKYTSKFGIYASSYLPIKYKKMILRRLYIKLKELQDNYIYPVTLAQKNDLFPFSNKEANVLLCGMDPMIIDVDGISAYYSDNYSEVKYNISMGSYSKLLLEVLSGIDINESDSLEDIDLIIEELIRNNIDKRIVDNYFSNNRLEEKEIKYLLRK